MEQDLAREQQLQKDLKQEFERITMQKKNIEEVV